jgi:hypothetical protein
MEPFDRNRMERRLESYYGDHQVGIHVTLLSVALGVAGISAASLLSNGASSRGHLPMFWLLWGVSLLAVGTVYQGLTVSVFALPSPIPRFPDVFLPFALGTSEFLLFGTLSPLANLDSARDAIFAWFISFAFLAAFAAVTIRRAMWLFDHGHYGADVAPAVRGLRRRMRADLAGSSGSALVSAAVASYIGASPTAPTCVAYIGAAAVGVALIIGLTNQGQAATEFQHALAELSRVRQPTPIDVAALSRALRRD